MNHLNPGLISAYNSLTDKHLAGYFSNTRIRRHLQRAGLITRSGRIVPDKEYRHKLIQRAHQRHVRECLAQAIFHKVLEMERVHQIEIKRKLEEFARRERVHKIKVERSKRYEEDVIRILSPRPPTAARGVRKQHSGPEGEHSESSESPGSSRPNTAPGTIQRPVRLKPIHSNATTASLRRSSPYRRLDSSNENDQPFNCTIEKQPRRRATKTEACGGVSPYCLPVINNFVTPVPPATKRRERGVKVTPSGALRGRRLRPTTASSGADVSEDPPMLRSSVHQSRVFVNMIYFGKTVHLSHNLTDMRDEVKVLQQHCGGENLCVFKGKLHEGEMFQFISRRHRGFPFSLTFFLNGLQVERLSSCCEFKHRKGSRLGGRHGYFGFSSVERASPCYKCIIAMGLDKKPSPPLKRVKESGEGQDSVTSPKDAAEMEAEMEAERTECETRQAKSAETRVKEGTAAVEDKVRDDYEEDFEADNEDPAEDPPPPPGDSERLTVKDRDMPEAEDVEKDEDVKSCSGSSSSGSDPEDSDAETNKESREDEEAEQLKEVDQEETDPKSSEPNAEESAETEGDPAAPKDSDIQDSAGDSTEIDVLDTSVPSGDENKLSDDSSGEKTGDDSKQEEEQDRAKSVQEKLAEAILKESQCSSEPELSDTSTEEEEELMDKGPEQDSKDVGKSVTFIEQQQEEGEETKCEEGADEADVAQDDEETCETEEQEDKAEKEPYENREAPEDETVTIEEEKQNVTSEDRKTAENDESESQKTTEDDKTSEPQEEEAAESAQKDEENKMTEDDKTSEPQEETAAESAQKDEENEEKTAAEADETRQEAKNSEEDESSVSALNQKSDESAAADNVEEEATTASQTMEMKAEPSEERQALNYEETPVTDTETRQQEDSEDRDAVSETEDKAENSSSSLEGSGDTTVEKTAHISEDKDESGKEEIKEEEHQEGRDDLEVEQTEIDDREEKCENESKEEEKTHPGEITEGEREEKDDKHKTEEEKSKTEESMENFSEGIKDNSKTNEEQAEEDESEKTDKGNQCVEDAEEMRAAADKTSEGEQIDAAPEEEKHDEAEKEEGDQNEDEAEKDVENKDDEESEEKLVDAGETANGEEISKITEESGKSADEDVKISDENIAESEDVVDDEAAQETETEDTEDVQEGPEEGRENSEKGEVDVENGEISPAAKKKSQEDERDVQTEGEDEVKAAEDDEDRRKTKEPSKCESAGDKEVTVESGDCKVQEFTETEVTQSEAKDPDEGVDKQDEPTANVSEPDTSGEKDKETSEDREETKQDENGNISDPRNESDDSDVMKKSDRVWSNVSEVRVASSETSAAVDSGDTCHQLNESMELSDKRPLNVDPSAVDGDNGADGEEASKASEEGASVLLNPQADLSQNKEKTEDSAAGSPEALETEDNTDLVNNWITMHQTSKFFETFIEPLEDLKESTSNSKEEATQPPEPRLASPSKVSGNTEQESTANDLKNKEDTVVVDVDSSQSGDERCEEDTQGEEEQEADSILKDSVAGPDVRSEELRGSSGSLHEDKTQEGLVPETDVSKTEVESLSGSHHSETSRRPESVSENQTNHPEDKKQRAAEATDLHPSPETPDPLECETSPDELSKLKYTWRQGEEQSREVTEISDFTTSVSDDGSQEESHCEDVQPKRSSASVNGDGRDKQLIQDIKHTVSRERLSAFSVDETLLARSSLPLLTAVRTESGH